MNPLVTRTAEFYLLHNPDDEDENYRWECRVIMLWTKDEDGASRTEIGHGPTADAAYALARAIAAAFMFEETVAPNAWPTNDIDHRPLPTN